MSSELEERMVKALESLSPARSKLSLCLFGLG